MPMTSLRNCLCLLIVALGVVQAQQSADSLAAAASKGDKAALAQLTTLADKGHAEAQFNLGMIYYGGFGVPKDPVQAVSWYRKAAEQGLSVALDSLVTAAGKGDRAALTQLTTMAEKGNAEAQEYLGDIYTLGSGVPTDFVQGAAWYRKAAEKGLPGAQYSLGTIYRDGQGVQKNAVQAVTWYRKAAENGLAGAQSALGNMYLDGDGVPKDLVSGYMWINLSAAQGDEKTKTLRDALERVMTPAQITEGQKLSREWKPKQ